jgi:hypothetical protein
MDITITLSDRAERLVREKASENGKPVKEFVEDFVEENLANGNGLSEARRHNLLAFAGKFNSGLTDTSERMSEILRETDFDPAEGFSVR